MSTSPVRGSDASLAAIIDRSEDVIVTGWIEEMSGAIRRKDLLKESELKAECVKMLSLMKDALKHGGSNVNGPEWEAVRGMLGDLSRSRAIQGFTPSDTASFVFSAKKPIFSRIRQSNRNDPDAMGTNMWMATELLDAMGLYTTEVYQQSRTDMIKRQQEELLELSTPVVKLWDGILALPIIGTLDSARTQIVMESLLQALVDNDAKVAIIDITGVPTVDTVVAQHLLKTVTAARLMGAECILSGVRPPIAQAIVHLGIDLADVTTKATLAGALKVALQRIDAHAPSASAK